MSFLPFIIYIIKLNDFCKSLFYINFDFCEKRKFVLVYINISMSFILKNKQIVLTPPKKVKEETSKCKK